MLDLPSSAQKHLPLAYCSQAQPNPDASAPSLAHPSPTQMHLPLTKLSEAEHSRALQSEAERRKAWFFNMVRVYLPVRTHARTYTTHTHIHTAARTRTHAHKRIHTYMHVHTH